MRYIRFVKPPQTQRGDDGQAPQVVMKVTITSDLGDSFYPETQDLLAQLVSEPSGQSGSSDATFIASEQSVTWRPGMRQISISLPVSSRVMDQRCVVRVAAYVGPTSRKPRPDRLIARRAPPLSQNSVSVWSDAFYPGHESPPNAPNNRSRGKKRSGSGVERPRAASNTAGLEQEPIAASAHASSMIQRRLKGPQNTSVQLNIWESAGGYAEHIW